MRLKFMRLYAGGELGEREATAVPAKGDPVSIGEHGSFVVDSTLPMHWIGENVFAVYVSRREESKEQGERFAGFHAVLEQIMHPAD